MVFRVSSTFGLWSSEEAMLGSFLDEGSRKPSATASVGATLREEEPPITGPGPGHQPTFWFWLCLDGTMGTPTCASCARVMPSLWLSLASFLQPPFRIPHKVSIAWDTLQLNLCSEAAANEHDAQPTYSQSTGVCIQSSPPHALRWPAIYKELRDSVFVATLKVL